MKLTKLEHACLVLEKEGAKIVVDPGSFTIPIVDPIGVTAVVITHEHPDHWTPEHLTRILEASPDAVLYGPAGVAAAASDFAIVTVAGGDTVTIGSFELSFFGEQHALIHESIPVIDNVGVLVDGSVYYPGDSFTVPPVSVETLVVPAGAPWLKIGEVMDFIVAVKPKRTLPTHQMVLSVIGQQLSNGRIAGAAESVGATALVLEPGESIEL